MRRMAGFDVSPSDYDRFGIATKNWPKVTDSTVRVRKSSKATVARPENSPDTSVTANAAPTFGPAASERLDCGDERFGFRILCEIGKGAFAKVYLARQTNLAGRNVVLKVSADDKRAAPNQEGDQLARLQHTNIVPIYSLHNEDNLTAICMPDFGACTLRDAVRFLQRQTVRPTTGRPFVDAIHERRSEVVSLLHANGRASTEPNTTSVPGVRVRACVRSRRYS